MSTAFEPGQYQGKVTNWALVKAKNEKKTPQFALTFLPLGRIESSHPEAPLAPCQPTERTVFRSITENTAARLLQDLQAAFGYPHESFAQLDPSTDNAFDFTDKEFTALLTFEEYEGKTRERWNFLSANGPYTGEPLTSAEVRRLDTLFGAAKPKKSGKKAKETEAAPKDGDKPANVQI